ncbi:hypothetical protein Plhal304r1_c009g0035781 [Plasmopara halstedii]
MRAGIRPTLCPIFGRNRYQQAHGSKSALDVNFEGKFSFQCKQKLHIGV